MHKKNAGQDWSLLAAQSDSAPQASLVPSFLICKFGSLDQSAVFSGSDFLKIKHFQVLGTLCCCFKSLSILGFVLNERHFNFLKSNATGIHSEWPWVRILHVRSLCTSKTKLYFGLRFQSQPLLSPFFTSSVLQEMFWKLHLEFCIQRLYQAYKTNSNNAFW